MTDEFSRFHPLVNIVFYIAVLGITMFQMQSVMIIISFICAVLYHIYLKKERSVKFCIMALFIFICSSVINPLFSHKGTTLLFYLFTGNPVTLESLIYGVFTSMIIVTMLFWLSTFNVIMCEDKILALVGKVLPRIALLLTMIFRFVKKVTRKSRDIAMTQEALHGKKDKLIEKIQAGMNNFSITTTWALENSVETADSMTARGYGSKRRTSYNNYQLEKRDFAVIFVIIALFIVVCRALMMGNVYTYYYPVVRIKNNIIVYITYIILCTIPLAVNVLEDIRWHRLKSKI